MCHFHGKKYFLELKNYNRNKKKTREINLSLFLFQVAKVMASKKDRFTVIPVLVGSISADKEAKYGQIFAKYLADPSNLFIISSDFCHWGDRFHYTYYDQTKGSIHQSIKALDYMVI